MARQLIAFAAGAILAVALFWMFRPAAPAEDTGQLLAGWLARDCAIGFDPASLDALRRDANQVEGMLKDIFEKGPPAAEVASAEATARLKYRQIHVRLRSGNPSGLPKPQADALLAESEDTYAQRARQDFINRRRSA